MVDGVKEFCNKDTIHPEIALFDDMKDGGGFQAPSDRLKVVLSFIHSTLFHEYSQHDRESIKMQKQHRMAAAIAIIFGSITIILSIVQVFFTAHSNFFGEGMFFLKIFEIFSIIIASTVVGIASLGQWHKAWLKKRFLAEQYRLLKYRSMIHPLLYCKGHGTWEERLDAWKNWLGGEVSLMRERGKKNLKDCIEHETIAQPPPDLSGCIFETNYLQEYISYYKKKRIMNQIQYFDMRAEQMETLDGKFRSLLGFFFVLGIIFAAIQIIIEVSPWKINILETVFGVIFLLIILLLPILSITFRTMRSSIETARSGALFRSKRNALKDFEYNLLRELDRMEPHWSNIITIIWECENYLSGDSREWLHIMSESEWSL